MARDPHVTRTCLGTYHIPRKGFFLHGIIVHLTKCLLVHVHLWSKKSWDLRSLHIPTDSVAQITNHGRFLLYSANGVPVWSNYLASKCCLLLKSNITNKLLYGRWFFAKQLYKYKIDARCAYNSIWCPRSRWPKILEFCQGFDDPIVSISLITISARNVGITCSHAFQCTTFEWRIPTDQLSQMQPHPLLR